MTRVLLLLVAIGIAVPLAAQGPSDPSAHAVSYVDVLPSGSSAMVAAYNRYRDASRNEDGFVRFELLEQVGRPAHFVVLETWRDPKAFEAHGMAAHAKQYRDALQSVRVSGYDERPYKVLVVSAATGARAGAAVHVVTHVDIAGAGAQAQAPGLLTRLAEESRKERGNLRFDVIQHTMRGNHYTIVETWQNQNALDAHAAAPHTKQYRDAMTPITGSPLDERVYKAID